jgi:hypothetical protein
MCLQLSLLRVMLYLVSFRSPLMAKWLLCRVILLMKLRPVAYKRVMFYSSLYKHHLRENYVTTTGLPCTIIHYNKLSFAQYRYEYRNQN